MVTNHVGLVAHTLVQLAVERDNVGEIAPPPELVGAGQVRDVDERDHPIRVRSGAVLVPGNFQTERRLGPGLHDLGTAGRRAHAVECLGVGRGDRVGEVHTLQRSQVVGAPAGEEPERVDADHADPPRAAGPCQG